MPRLSQTLIMSYVLPSVQAREGNRIIVTDLLNKPSEWTDSIEQTSDLPTVLQIDRRAFHYT